MKYKVANLEGALLDAAVAKAEDVILVWENFERLDYSAINEIDGRNYRPSVDWRIGGKIIERWCIKLERWHDFPEDETDATPEQPWDAFIDYKGGGWGIGRTPLVAAMRAFVHLKFGDEVELP